MKIKRSKLRKIIREFVDTYKDSYRPSLAKPSVYEQLSNSERNAFIQAMGVVSKVSGGEKLDEGTVTRFPSGRVRPPENEDEDPVGPPGGEVVRFMPYETDLPGDTSHLEADEEDMTSREIEMLRKILSQKRDISQRARSTDASSSIEDEIADLVDAYELGNLSDLFADER
jgi:hypothetical protein